MNRRQFLIQAGLGSAATLLDAACSRDSAKKVRRQKQGTPEARPRVSPAPSDAVPSFQVVEAAGGPFEVGAAIGMASRSRVAALIKRRRAWFEELKKFALADRASRLDGFVAAIKKHHPEIMEEIRGMARGALRPLDDLLVLNLQTELSALKEKSGCCGCSTLHLVHGGRILLAHNEDDHDANRDLVFLVRVRPKDRPAFVSLAYPGVIPGNVPAMTEAGIVRTTNYIGATEVRVGVPRYVLGRAALHAKTIDEAVKLVTNPAGAYSFHVNLGSRTERRLVSLEVAPGGKHDAKETRNEIYVHTNHYILPKTKNVPQLTMYVGGSSDSRYRVLTRAVRSLPPLEKVGPDHLIRLLSSHQAVTKPYSPCRHPHGKVLGRTVATALFDVGAGTFTLYEGNPCEEKKRQIGLV